MPKEYIIYCDESIAKGTHYSDFYGGVLVSSEHINQVQEFLKVKKEQLGVFEEIKWTKTNEFTLEGYKEMMTAFFDLLETDVLKVRIMFRQSAFQAANLTNDQKEVHYFLLYYQFVKHAFGLVYSNDTTNEVYLRTYFDELPENPLKAELFKNYIYGLQSLRGFEEAKINERIFWRSIQSTIFCFNA